MYKVACKNLKVFENIVQINRQDAAGVDKIYKTIDILHVDLGNEAGILEKIVPNWIDKTGQLIIIEGGSEERDERSWMTQNVIDALNAYTQAYGINNWYVLGRKSSPPGEKRDRWRSWMFVKS